MLIKMTTTLAIERLTLSDLEQRFGLEETQDPNFFREWQESLPELSDLERDRLARVRAEYTNLERRSLLEKTVELVVLAPLLDLAGFFLPPFYIETEKPIEVTLEDEDVKLRGRLDILILRDRLWVLAIESKRAEFSLKVGIPQLLGYMLLADTAQSVRYGFVTNGESFLFLKLATGDSPCFSRSKVFLLGQDSGLEIVQQILKHLANLLATN